ncbi:FAD-binding oxidoreductase [Mycolicibacterium agri]|nr:FAD-binding oxidoreductase [Mycolicibacterium agri]GFG51085.1 oxidoreductase [Mycolicibacterium agri]
MSSWRDSVPELQKRLSGRAFTPESAGYDNEIAVFNTAVQHRPALVVGAADAEDVVQAVRFAARHGLHIAVLNTGHGPSLPAGDGALMITTRRMSEIAIDTGTGTARVEAGVRFGDLVQAAAVHGLAPLAGSAPGVGVVGYTLGGGASLTMGRKFGWAADHVSAIDVVTADGQLRRVSAHSEADLFGGLLGGKSNFGVVTAMEFALFAVTHLYAGALFYAGEHIRGVLQEYRRFTMTAPDEISSGVTVLNLPPMPGLPSFMTGKLIVSVSLSCVGNSVVGKRLVEPLRHAAPLLMDTMADIPYNQFGQISAEPTDPAPALEHFGLLRELTDDTVKAIVEVVDSAAHNGINIIHIRHLGGAFGRPPAVANAVGSRDAAFAFFALTVVPPGHRVADYRDCGAELVEALKPWLHDHAHPGLLGPADATVERTRRAYDPATYRMLQIVKTMYDARNSFRFNHNVPPG